MLEKDYFTICCNIILLKILQEFATVNKYIYGYLPDSLYRCIVDHPYPSPSFHAPSFKKLMSINSIATIKTATKKTVKVCNKEGTAVLKSREPEP